MNGLSHIALPNLESAKLLSKDKSRCYIGAYGFETRSQGWTAIQARQGSIVQKAFIFRYVNGRSGNKIDELKHNLHAIGVEGNLIQELPYDLLSPYAIEDTYDEKIDDISKFDEIILDVTAMTKFLILVSLCKLADINKKVRIVYSEAMHYAPERKEFNKYKTDMTALAKFPNRGFGSIIRARCLSSIRMQGQPVTLIAFTSFNEQLIRHMLGTISPHRLILINGQPPREEFRWREHATQEIHQKLLEEFSVDNPLDSESRLLNVASTLYYKETIKRIHDIYSRFGLYERIMAAATGSKMQTVGLFFAKMLHPDIHIEYPAPESYFVQGMSEHVRAVHEISFEDFSKQISEFRRSSLELTSP